MLRRLLLNEAGNIMALTAAATLPMLAVIGGAVDISRMYLTKSRVQAACDSAVLAGRKAMSTNTYSTAAKNRANTMFNFNFQDADYGTNNTSFASSADSEGKVSGTATTTLPMVIMGMFGAGPANLSVTCSADLQIPNIDVVLVLDVTGSMDETIGGTKKINSLKVAAKDFYDTLAAAMVGNTQSQIRYGFVPYSQAVNVKDLFKASPDASKGELPLSHLSDTMVVQSRVANFTTLVDNGWKVDPNATPVKFTQIFSTGSAASKAPYTAVTASGTNISQFDCDQYASNLSFQIDQGTTVQVNLVPRLSSSWSGESQGSSVLYIPEGSTEAQANEPSTGETYTRITFERVSGSTNSTYSACTRRVTQTRYIRDRGYKITNWTHKPVTYAVSAYKGSTALSYTSSVSDSDRVATSGSYDPVALRALGVGSSSNATWGGCIEERDTVAVSNFAPIPSGALDLNYIDGGTTDSRRWRPILRDLAYTRDAGTASQNYNNSYTPKNPVLTCPGVSIRNLNVMTKTQYDNYINSLSAGGNTYLDVGMIWGLRLINPQGMFSSRNLTGPNGGQISRHIIFLTDGVPAEATSAYTAYGVENLDKRIAGSTGVQPATLHSRRFQALCDAQRGAVSIWAIAFGTSVTGNLSNCADPGRAFQANNTTQLRDAFKTIAKQVADLRLVE